MSNFEERGFLSSVIESFESGLDTGPFKQVTGDTDYEKLSYPAAQYFPDSSDYQGDLTYEDTHTIFFIFESGKRESKLLDNTKEIEKALDNLQEELESNSIVENFKPESFRYLVGENSNNLLDIIRVDYSIDRVETFR